MDYLVVFPILLSICSAGLIDRGQDALDTANYDIIPGFYRVEMHVDRLDTQGNSHTGFKCDAPIVGNLIGDTCDPKIKAFIDTERPNHDFGDDSVPYDEYIVLLEGSNTPDVVPVGKTISRDVCGKNIRKIAMRVRAVDKDPGNDDKIDNYKCFITGSKTNMPAKTEQDAQWSAEIACEGEDRKSSKVYLKYRWYAIPEQQCRPSSNKRPWYNIGK